MLTAKTRAYMGVARKRKSIKAPTQTVAQESINEAIQYANIGGSNLISLSQFLQQIDPYLIKIEDGIINYLDYADSAPGTPTPNALEEYLAAINDFRSSVDLRDLIARINTLQSKIADVANTKNEILQTTFSTDHGAAASIRRRRK